jgi:hypothetical protein
MGKAILSGAPALVAAICKLVGVSPSRVRRIELVFEVHEPVIATFDLYGQEGDEEPLLEALTSETYAIDRID